MVAAVRSTSGLGIVAPAAFIRTTYGLGERNRTASIRTTYGLGQLTAAAGVRSTSGTGFVAVAGSAPLVVAGPPQDVSSGTTVHLTASATAAPGSAIASYAWRLVSRDAGAPLPTLSSSSAQNPTVLAVPSLKKYTMTFGVTATDSLGRRSVEAQVVVTVERVERVKATTSGWTLPVARAKAVAGEWT